MNWTILGLVMSGGALGAAGRYLVGDLALRHFSQGMPWGTLIVNLLGSFAAGYCYIWLENRGANSLYWRGFWVGLPRIRHLCLNAWCIFVQKKTGRLCCICRSHWLPDYFWFGLAQERLKFSMRRMQIESSNRASTRGSVRQARIFQRTFAAYPAPTKMRSGRRAFYARKPRQIYRA